MKMICQFGKPLIFAFILGLFLTFSTIVSAQDKNAEQKNDLGGETKSLSVELKIGFEKKHTEDSQNSIDLTKTVQSKKLDEKNNPAQKSVERKERFGEFIKAESPNSTYKISSNAAPKTEIKSLPNESTKYSVRRKMFDMDNAPPKEGFQWRSAIQQSLFFLAVQHGYAFTQSKTREALKGKFFKDYAKSVKSLKGWDDGGKFFTNYLAHPMQGSFTGFIYVQNDPKAKRLQFGKSGDYWRSRLKAFAWTTIWSTQFEIGPISQASIGNIGLKDKQTWEDIVVTPTLGTVMLITEDALDRYIIQRIERKTDNFYIRIFSRMLLNPTRFFANLVRLKAPWYRDRPYAH